MSTRELAKSLIDQVPENKLLYIIAYLQGAAIPDESETPNADTLEAFEELDNGGGHTFKSLLNLVEYFTSSTFVLQQ